MYQNPSKWNLGSKIQMVGLYLVCLFDVSKFFKCNLRLEILMVGLFLVSFLKVSKSFEMQFAMGKPDGWFVVGVCVQQRIPPCDSCMHVSPASLAVKYGIDALPSAKYVIDATMLAVCSSHLLLRPSVTSRCARHGSSEAAMTNNSRVGSMHVHLRP